MGGDVVSSGLQSGRCYLVWEEPAPAEGKESFHEVEVWQLRVLQKVHFWGVVNVAEQGRGLELSFCPASFGVMGIPGPDRPVGFHSASCIGYKKVNKMCLFYKFYRPPPRVGGGSYEVMERNGKECGRGENSRMPSCNGRRCASKIHMLLTLGAILVKLPQLCVQNPDLIIVYISILNYSERKGNL